MQRSLVGALILSMVWGSACGRGEPLRPGLPTVPVVQDPALVIVTPSVVEGVIDSPYSSTIQSTGGRAPYLWRISDGALPEGLGLGFAGEASLAIVGVPSRRGLYGFELEVSDASGQTQKRVFDLTILDAQSDLQIVTPVLPPLIAERAAAVSVEAEGGVPPYTWQASDLPPGLTIQGRGTPATTLGGVPSEAGEFEFEVTVSDAMGAFSRRAYVLSIAANVSELRILTNSLPVGEVLQAYASNVLSEGGAPPYQWQVSQGRLPAGLRMGPNIQPALQILGTPEVAGTHRFVLRLSAGDGQSIERSFVLRIEAAPPGLLEITTTTLPAGTESMPYRELIQAQGGVPPYEWGLGSGALPLGLNLEVAVGLPGTRLAGVPRVAGTYNFEVVVSDAANMQARRRFILEVQPTSVAPSITTTTLDAMPRCHAFDQVLTARDGIPPYTWSMLSGPPGLEVRSTGGTSAVLVGYPDFVGNTSVILEVRDGLGRPGIRGFQATGTDSMDYKRWAGLVGRFTGSPDIYLSNLCAIVPPVAVRVNVGVGGLYQNYVALSEDGRKLAYIGDFNTSGVQELFVVDLQGTTPGTPVRVHSAGTLGRAVERFSFSPDGNWLAYAHNLNGLQTQVSVVDVSNAAQPGLTTVLSSVPGLASPVVDELLWSPQSHRLAIRGSYEVAGRQDLYVASVVPGIVARRVSTLTRANGDVSRALWSPRGEGLVYVADQDTDEVSELYWVGAGGPSPLPPPVVKMSSPLGGRQVPESLVGFSSGGAFVAFVSESPSQGSLLFTAQVGSVVPGLPTLANTLALPNLDIAELQWSPQQPRLAFVASSGMDPRRQIFIAAVPASGSASVVQLASGITVQQEVQTGAGNFSWSPDGNWLGYIVAPLTGQFAPKTAFAMSVAGPTVATYPVAPIVVGPGLEALSIQFSPDSDRLAVAGHVRVPDHIELFTVDLQVTPPGFPVRASSNLVVGGNVDSLLSGYAFRSDGQGLIYLADQTRNGIQEAWSASFLSSSAGTSSPMHLPLAPSRGVERIIVP